MILITPCMYFQNYIRLYSKHCLSFCVFRNLPKAFSIVSPNLQYPLSTVIMVLCSWFPSLNQFFNSSLLLLSLLFLLSLSLSIYLSISLSLPLSLLLAQFLHLSINLHIVDSQSLLFSPSSLSVAPFCFLNLFPCIANPYLIHFCISPPICPSSFLFATLLTEALTSPVDTLSVLSISLTVSMLRRKNFELVKNTSSAALRFGITTCQHSRLPERVLFEKA